MEIVDIHTHRLPETPGQAIISCLPKEFSPQPRQYYSVGFHPWSLSAVGNEDWAKFNEILLHPQVLAIGETGLDKIREVDFSLQEAAFERQIVLGILLQKPLVIHAVKSYNEIIQFKKSFRPDNPWIIHGFRGKKELAIQLTDQGVYLSFGENYQEDALCAIPVDKLFLETDDSRVSIHNVYEQAARRLSLSVADLTAQIHQNINNVFFIEKDDQTDM